MMSDRGSLTVVGCGIRAPAQATLEAVAHIGSASLVYSVVADPLAFDWIRSLNPATESLTSLYAVGKARWQTYAEMVACILSAVRAGERVCAVAYGHPGVFAYPLHEAVRQARAEGFGAEMLAGVSADACLFAELGVDPGTSGCRSYEATDFLVRGRGIDTATSLILWQIGLIGESGYKAQRTLWNQTGLRILAEILQSHYCASHEVTLFEAARFSGIASRIVRVALSDLLDAPVNPMSTLYVPPLTKARIDVEMAARLGIDPTDPKWRRPRPEQENRRGLGLEPATVAARDVDDG